MSQDQELLYREAVADLRRAVAELPDRIGTGSEMAAIIIRITKASFRVSEETLRHMQKGREDARDV
jgi:hypothetical protein